MAASSKPADSEHVLRERRHVDIAGVEDDKHEARTHTLGRAGSGGGRGARGVGTRANGGEGGGGIAR